MVKVGIDTLAIYTSQYALQLATLAEARGIDAEKYHTGLGQFSMSVPPPGEDIVTMAANAAKQALQDIDLTHIELLLFATESGIDQSKAAGIFVHHLLGLEARCRVVELKQACYSATAALQLALPFLRENPNKKVLLIASDIARYGLNTAGESSQGAGAIAMVLSANPRILAFEPEYGVVTESVMDFWRPNYSHEAFVDGKYSSKLYLTLLEKSWEQYQQLSGRQFADHDYFCYHTPVPRLVEKAHQHLLKINAQTELPVDVTDEQFQASLAYGRKMGNSYSAALYVALASLLDNVTDDLSGKRIGFYSYGSGCVAEYFSGVVQPGYQQVLHADYHAGLLSGRKQLTYEDYVAFYTFKYNEEGQTQDVPVHSTGAYRLTRLQQHKRVYEKTELAVCDTPITHKTTMTKLNKTKDHVIKVLAPGKLILSGEHAVVHGQPALAMAVNRYVTATITHDAVPQILFDLSDLAHHSRLSVTSLRHLKDKLKQKYHSFIRGDFGIRDVLQKPFELAQFALGVFADAMNLTLPHGVKIQVQSDLPIGCGMGSSAATIISVMQAVSDYTQTHLSTEQLFQLALEAENMQHGHSSGLDLRVAMHGGCIYVNNGEIEQRSIPSFPLYLVNTGTPVTSTGQCVEKVASHFQSEQMKNEFAAVTKAMDSALKNQSWHAMRDAIAANHKLLVAIGVVPAKVQQFIADVEAMGGAAKICGAGAVMGDQAGAVMVAADNQHDVIMLSKRFGYNVIPIAGEMRGVHAA